MTAVPVTSLPHPLVCGVESLHAILDTMPIAAWDGLEPCEAKRLCDELAHIQARVSAQQTAGVRRVDESGLARKSGATSTGSMLAGAFGGDRAAGDRLVRSAKALKSASRTEEALSRGEISSSQAEVIASAIGSLSDEVTAEQRQACEDTLIGDARRFTIKDLRRRALRVTDAFKPKDEVDADENAALVSLERSARARSEFWLVNQRDGTVRGGFTIPEAAGDMLLSAIQGISAPRRDHLHRGTDVDGNDSVYDRDLDHRHRLGMGFAELCEHLPTDRLPSAGGVGATLMVRFDYDTLVDGVAPATLSTGTRLSAGQVRKLACRVGIIPQVFDGKSLPLDHGAEKRFFTKHQRRAMEDRDGGCTFPGCDRPPAWCEAHHARNPWAIGKTTRLEEGVLICARHHHVVHDAGWSIRFHPDDGIPEYRPHGTLQWQRNTRWRP